MKMWHLIKQESAVFGEGFIKAEGDEIALEAVIFEDKEALKDYTDDGYTILGVYDVKLLEGQENLPTNFQGERQ